jgi:DNA polymerase III subunit epsilon
VTSPPPAPLRFGVVDLETTGLSVDRHRILQLGLVVYEIPMCTSGCGRRGRVVDQWSSYVKLRRPWHRLGPRHIHGIRRRDLRGAPGLAETLTELAERLDGSIFAAHNAAFDGGFLELAARAEGIDLDLGPQLCTLRMSRRLDPERTRSHRLGDLCVRYGVSLDRPHDAVHDALATAEVLAHLVEAHGITCAEQLAPFYERR